MEFEITEKLDFRIVAKDASGKQVFISPYKHPATHQELMSNAKVGDKVQISVAESKDGRYFCTETTMRKIVDKETGEVTSFLDAQKALLELDTIKSTRRQLATKERLLNAQADLAEKALA